MRPVFRKLPAPIDQFFKSRAIVRAHSRKRHHVMRGAHDIHTIDLQQPQPPDRITEMPRRGTARPRSIKPLRRQRDPPCLGQRYGREHWKIMVARTRYFEITCAWLRAATSATPPRMLPINVGKI